MRTLILLSICVTLSFFICGRQGSAFACIRGHYNHYLNDPAMATGAVQAVGRNTIDIYDEEQRKVERFIYFEYGEKFYKGDYVRIYYHPRGAVAQKIKRITVLEYKKNNQNLGYICR